MLLKAIQEFMPHYPLDDRFVQALPAELRQILEKA
jgi:hypothetical protein